MTNKQEAKRHHYTPQFLMDKWVVRNSSGHNHLNALYWDSHKACVRCKSDRGPKSYCHQNRLFTFENPHPQGKDAIESQFFSEIDTKGAEVRDMLLNLEGSITKLSVEQRRDWVRLLLSLVARRPENISKLKGEYADSLRSGFDDEEEIKIEMQKESLDYSPAEYVENEQGASFKDMALSIVQSAVDNPKVGKILLNAHWYVMHLDKDAESIILSDRPLIRINAYGSPNAVWVLPIDPSVVFIAVSNIEILNRLLRMSQKQFSKKMNVSSAIQADKFLFSTTESHKIWVGKYLKTQHC